MITAEDLTVADPSAEDISAVSLGKLYVYYGGHENRSREGEGLWFILNPTKTDLTAETYTWENDKPKGDFKKKEAPKPVAADVQMTSYSASWTRRDTRAGLLKLQLPMELEEQRFAFGKLFSIMV